MREQERGWGDLTPHPLHMTTGATLGSCRPERPCPACTHAGAQPVVAPTLVEFLRACITEDHQQAEKLKRFAQETHLTFQDHKRFLGRDVPGWHTWPDVEALCARTLDDIAAKKAILDAYAATVAIEEGASVRIKAAMPQPSAEDLRTWSRAHNEASTLRELAILPLAQPHAGRPGWQAEWAVKA